MKKKDWMTRLQEHRELIIAATSDDGTSQGKREEHLVTAGKNESKRNRGRQRIKTISQAG